MNIMVTSLGCDKNLVDTEMMLGSLASKGYHFVEEEIEADIAIINTCCFIHDAKEESVEAILDMAKYKEIGKLKVLIVTGCLAQRYKEEIQTEIPEVDVIIGTTAMESIPGAIEEVILGKAKNYYQSLNEPCLVGQKRVITTGGYFAYLKIAEGCDKHCTYCIIPKIRGNFRSVPIEDLERQARDLADSGVRELILVAQESTLYGKDLYGEKSLSKLLKTLAKISGIYWIRLLYCYPEEVDDILIQTIKEEEKVCNYLDIPIQHCNDDILKKMGRRTNQTQLREVIAQLKREIPDMCLRTTLITGFPGETQEQHEEVIDFIDDMEFDRLGVFTYSPEEDTPAALMDNQIEEEIKQIRKAEIMEMQQAIAYELGQDMIGKKLMVMVEGKVVDEDVYIARTYKDAPNVDGYLFIHTTAILVSGEFIEVMVTDNKDYDLIGEIN